MDKNISIDPRSAILLLLSANIVSFIQCSLYIEVAFIIFLCIVLWLCDCRRAVFKWCLFCIGIIICQYLLYPLTHKIFVTGYSVAFVYARKILPCLMVGTIIVKKLKLSYIKAALEKWRIPQSIIIPLLITVRYIPSMIEESSHIRNAIKLRCINGFKKVEYTLIPLIMSAINTSEELSAAAVTRGIENPCRKISIINLRMKVFDYIILFTAFVFVVLSILSRRYAI